MTHPGLAVSSPFCVVTIGRVVDALIDLNAQPVPTDRLRLGPVDVGDALTCDVDRLVALEPAVLGLPERRWEVLLEERLSTISGLALCPDRFGSILVRLPTSERGFVGVELRGGVLALPGRRRAGRLGGFGGAFGGAGIVSRARRIILSAAGSQEGPKYTRHLRPRRYDEASAPTSREKSQLPAQSTLRRRYGASLATPQMSRPSESETSSAWPTRTKAAQVPEVLDDARAVTSVRGGRPTNEGHSDQTAPLRRRLSVAAGGCWIVHVVSRGCPVRDCGTSPCATRAALPKAPATFYPQARRASSYPQ